MTTLQAWEVVMDEVTDKGGHSLLETLDAALTLGQYVLAQIPKPGPAPSDVLTQPDAVEHLNALKAHIQGAAVAPGKINWGNLLQVILPIIIKVLGGLTGAPVAGS